jgi:hypothetical protein
VKKRYAIDWKKTGKRKITIEEVARMLCVHCGYRTRKRNTRPIQHGSYVCQASKFWAWAIDQEKP